mmetsp:Transcript_9325/g.20238  ORF Transcript_9325/g.20238 Transcript_9325/m.20238 type:complete len:219 (-) Transcript_9325:16-672(-)
MLPLNAGPPIDTNFEIPPDVQDKFRKIRYCIIGINIAAIGRFCLGDLPLSEIIACICGVFLLKEDETLGCWYACLMKSPIASCAQSGGGMACCMPFAIITAMNCFILPLRLWAQGPFTLISFISQLAASVLAWKIHSRVSELGYNVGGPLGSGFGGALSQPLSQSGMFGGAGGQMAEPGGQQGPTGQLHPPSGAQPQTGGPGAFSAFHGSGRRLGDPE